MCESNYSKVEQMFQMKKLVLNILDPSFDISFGLTTSVALLLKGTYLIVSLLSTRLGTFVSSCSTCSSLTSVLDCREK